ncbi:CBR-TAG-241 protein [Loa loa]|uniref:CBR-TAG-241 protein n=1 Tax=Loa loa TaxID=7209 RepID=A0A1I7VNG8_LOALO|nr:CBR-TAG-241 protein [Loa loa]EJD76702.1 CBR-TAG-241 protein [Loa loa]
MSSEASCSGFEPQIYLRERCKNCFSLRSKHNFKSDTERTAIISNNFDNSSMNISQQQQQQQESLATLNATKERSREKRRSWRDKTSTGPDNGAPEHINEGVEEDTTSYTSYKSINSKDMSSEKSVESISDTKSMNTAISESIQDDERAMTPMEGDLNFDATMMKAEIAHLREEVTKLKDERQKWMLRREKREYSGDESLIEMLEERLAEAENCIQDYRDENTVLKCELRELQECEGSSDSRSEMTAKLADKLKASESLCDELMEENESLKADIKDLQQEIEEMQDQYREEEIEEFRELQRELEQNAKNCRILQFKLRKSERTRDELDAEKQHLEVKVKDLLEASSVTGGLQTTGKQLDTIRIRELESELRIAKEVSVRLHNELETAEEKRYKLEDEVFYMKDKIRELQTQNKWREARNRTELQSKKGSADLLNNSTSSNTSKEIQDILEREADLRDQLKFAEEDLRRMQLRLQDVENENEELLRKLTRLKTVKRPPMLRSFSEGHAQMQLELAEHEMEHLSTKVERLEKKNIHLSKKIMEMELDSKKTSENGEIIDGKAKQFEVPPEMQRDIGKLMTTISELERKNLDLSLQLKQQNELNSSVPSEKSQAELRIEREHKRIIETELMELKRMMLQSDNQKLISMATKVELLNNQLLLVNDRCSNLHRRIVKEGGNETAYMDSLKNKCEELERQLSEEKAKNAINCSQIDSATTDEIEQCCEVLASVEAQTNRICKQIEKIDSAQKDERRRSLSKDSSATIIAELASVMSELNNVHQLLEAHKVNIASVARGSPVKNISNVNSEPKPCSKCKESETCILSQKDEIMFYKKKNKELTNQVLQTEDRWTAEIEKQRQSYENEVRILHTKLNDAQKNVIEQEHLLESRTVALAEKALMIQERDEKCDKLKKELLIVKKEIQDIEANRRSAKEFEIKYKKLESMFNLEKEKLAEERTKSKSEVTMLKKKFEETLIDLEKLRNNYVKKEKAWQEKRDKLEDELACLRKQLNKDAANDSTEGTTTVSDLSSSVTVKHQLAAAPVLANQKNDDIADLKDQQIATLQMKNKELTNQISDAKRVNEDLRMELASLQQKWTKDKNDLLHKARQEEKIRNVELDALQQKFASRMRIMEDTNKSLHSQLVQARRDRDYHREALHNFESKVSEEQCRAESDIKRHKELERRSADMAKQIEDLKEEVTKLNADLKLAKETHEADRALWDVEKSHIKSRRMTASANNNIADAQNVKVTESALKTAEMVQKKYAEYQNFYAKEVERLNMKMKELVNENLAKQHESEKTIKNLREQIKVLEISQRNLMEARDMQLGAKEFLESELERLQEMLNLNEVHRLTRKYKFSLIIDRLQILIDSLNKSSNIGKDSLDNLKAFISQLKQMKEEEYKSFPISNGKKQSKTDENPRPAESESSSVSQATSDATLQSTTPTQFYSYSTLPTSSYKLTATVKQLSESNSAVEIRQLEAITNGTQSPIKKISPFPDPPPTFILNKEMVVEYDKDGRLHYIPKSISRSASRDRCDDNDFASYGQDDGDDSSTGHLHLRTNSTGTNILYDIRRIELARGTQPSVRLMAKAFDTMEANASKTLPNSKRSLFGIRKSRSVETSEVGKGIGSATKSVLTSLAPSPVAVTVLGRNTSLIHIEELMGSQSPFGNVSRGSRNPFKLMKTKLVERVRRSLSRSNSKRHRDNSTGSGQSIKRGDESSTIADQEIEVLEKFGETKDSHTSSSLTKKSTSKPRIKKKVKKTATTS